MQKKVPGAQTLAQLVGHPLWQSLLVVCCGFCLSVAVFGNDDRKSDKPAASQQKSPSQTAHTNEGCEVENFGKVNDNYYRGAQPEAEQYNQLAALGIRTIIDLRDDPKEFAQPRAELAGMRYLNLPMSDKKTPVGDSVKRFMEVINNKANWPIFVHCAGGRHRTGAMTAVFRMTMEGWDIKRAYDEMKDYDFYTRWGHKAMKTFVFDYYKDLQIARQQSGEQPQIAPNQIN